MTDTLPQYDPSHSGLSDIASNACDRLTLSVCVFPVDTFCEATPYSIAPPLIKLGQKQVLPLQPRGNRYKNRVRRDFSVLL